MIELGLRVAASVALFYLLLRAGAFPTDGNTPLTKTDWILLYSSGLVLALALAV